MPILVLHIVGAYLLSVVYFGSVENSWMEKCYEHSSLITASIVILSCRELVSDSLLFLVYFKWTNTKFKSTIANYLVQKKTSVRSSTENTKVRTFQIYLNNIAAGIG